MFEQTLTMLTFYPFLLTQTNELTILATTNDQSQFSTKLVTFFYQFSLSVRPGLGQIPAGWHGDRFGRNVGLQISGSVSCVVGNTLFFRG